MYVYSIDVELTFQNLNTAQQKCSRSDCGLTYSEHEFSIFLCMLLCKYVTRFAKKVPFHTQNLTHFLNFETT